MQAACKNEKNCDILVYLLGTGGPEFTPNRFGISTLLMIENKPFLFDIGRGASQRIYESGISVDSIDKIFLTHLHNDHIEGLPNLWMSPWFLLRRKKNLSIWGPTGTVAMKNGMIQMYNKDYNDRSNDLFKQSYLDINVTEYSCESIVYDNDGIVISVFPVEHGDGNPAYAYKIEYKNRSIVLSGDTTYNENIVKYGKGADLIVHNVIGISDEAMKLTNFAPVLAKLTTPEQAADVFCETSPRLAVFSHICKKGLSGISGDNAIIDRVRSAGYKGSLAMGYDRMVIEIGEEIVVREPNSLEGLKDLQ